MQNDVTFAKRLKDIREARGLTQQELAEKIGISRVACGYYEKGDRHPDYRVIKLLCQGLDISADYLLGLSDTKQVEFAKIADTTGLSEKAIKYLETTQYLKRSIVNHILQEEYVPYPRETLPYIESMHKSDEELYEEYLRSEERRRNDEAKSILEHISDEWEALDYLNNESEEEMIARSMQFETEESILFHNIHEEHPINETAQQYAEFEKFWAYEANEKKKSNLLSCIEDFITYQSGCSLYTFSKEEQLSETHYISMGIGNGKTVVFPSEESDKLFEFMLIQKVIDALRIFKKNYYERR